MEGIDMQKDAFGIIGYGKMGSSILKGALKSALFDPSEVTVYDLDPSRRTEAAATGIKTVNSIEEVANCSQILVAVKPKDVPALAERLKAIISKGRTLVISIAAGVKISNLESRLGEGTRIIRVMPNIAAAVGEAASVYVANRNATKQDIAFASKLLNGIGVAYQLEDETLIDTVTGLSGSGPAYFFYIMRALDEVGRRSGLPAPLARSLVSQTCKGAGALAAASSEEFDRLIRFVASPGGTTEEALKIIDAKGVSSAIIDAATAAIEKAKRMNY